MRSGRVERAALPKTRAEESRVIAAQKWLTGHHRDMEVPGFYRRGLPALASRSGVLLFVCQHAGVSSAARDCGPERGGRPEADPACRWILAIIIDCGLPAGSTWAVEVVPLRSRPSGGRLLFATTPNGSWPPISSRIKVFGLVILPSTTHVFQLQS